MEPPVASQVTPTGAEDPSDESAVAVKVRVAPASSHTKSGVMWSPTTATGGGTTTTVEVSARC